MVSKKRNIVVLIRALISGGAEKQSLLLAKALNNYHNISFIVLKGDIIEQKHLQFIVDLKLKLVRLEGTRFRRIITLMKYLKEENIEIIFSFLTSDNFWGAIAGRLTGVKYIAGGIRTSKMIFYKLIVNRVIHQIFQTYTIFNSHYAKDRFMKKFGFIKRKSIVIANCLKCDNLPIIRNKKEIIKIITVCRFIPSKGIDTTIRAFSTILEDHNLNGKHIELNIIGYGLLESEIIKWVRMYKIYNNTRIIIKPDNLSDLYREADIYVCSSWYEGLSNSIMEAMSYSLPVVASNVGDNHRLVEHGINGFLYKSKDYIELAGYIVQLAKSHVLRQNFGKKSYDKVTKNYSFERFTENYLSFIEKLK